MDGHRYHDRPMRQWFVSELQEAVVKSVHDVQMILNYLSTRGDLDLNRIGMFGQGSGGTIAILVASVDPRIKAINGPPGVAGESSSRPAHSALRIRSARMQTLRKRNSGDRL